MIGIADGATDLAPSVGRNCDQAVLVLRALGLGDALTGIPALRGIRQAWPDRFIVLAAPTVIGRWLRQLGLVDEVLVTDGLAPLAWPPTGWIGIGGHVAVNLHGSGPRSHLVLGTTAPDELIAYRCPLATHLTGPSWRVDEHEVDRWCRLVNSAGDACDADDLRLAGQGGRGEYVVLHPGAASEARRWPAERWAALVERLTAAGRHVVISGGADERRLCRSIAQQADVDDATRRSLIQLEAGSKDLPGLAELIGRAALMISGDTGVAHLATALATPSVMLFGPTPPAWWGPRIDPELHSVLWAAEPGYRGDPHGKIIDPALARISAEQVLDAASAQLTRSAPAPTGQTSPQSGRARRAS